MKYHKKLTRTVAMLVATAIGLVLVLKYWPQPAGMGSGKPLPPGKVRPQIILVDGVGMACLLAPDGRLWGWGRVGGNRAVGRPRPIGPPEAHWLQLAENNCSALGLQDDGTLWAWGWNQQDGPGFEMSLEPKQIGRETDWVQVAVGDAHSVALKQDGSLWAWGHNGTGQVGDGTTTNQPMPVRIGSDQDWRSIAAGHAVSAALKSNGTIWAWGLVGHLQLVPSQLNADTNWLAVTAGYDEMLAIKSDGTLWRQVTSSAPLGTLTPIGPFRVDLHKGEAGLIPGTLAQIGSDHDWREVQGKGVRYFARKRDGSCWVWGFFDGTNSVLPQRVPFDFDPWVFAPGARTTLVLTRDGTLWTTGLRIQATPYYYQLLAPILRRWPSAGAALFKSQFDASPFRLWKLPAAGRHALPTTPKAAPGVNTGVSPERGP